MFKKNSWWEILELIRLIGNTSVLVLGILESHRFSKVGRGSPVYKKLHLT